MELWDRRCYSIRDARVANVMRRVDEFSPALVGCLANPGGQSSFEVEEALLVMLNVHDCSPQRCEWSCDSPITACTARRRRADAPWPHSDPGRTRAALPVAAADPNIDRAGF